MVLALTKVVKHVAAWWKLGCGLVPAWIGAAACSAEEVRPATAMPEGMVEGSNTEQGAGALEPASSSPDDLPVTGRDPDPTAGGMDRLPEEGRPPERPPLSADLPDLVLDSAYLLDSTRFETQRIDDPCAVQQGCATGLGERRIVRFGSRMGNVGNADLVLGAPNEQNPLFARDACTDGFSVPRFARYELRDTSGRLVLQGSKNPVCITDSEAWLPESGAECQTFSCGRQGIAPGCADNYGIDLPCQWLDITDVAPGTYELEVILNAERSLEELDYSNNSATLRLEVSAAGGTVQR